MNISENCLDLKKEASAWPPVASLWPTMLCFSGAIEILSPDPFANRLKYPGLVSLYLDAGPDNTFPLLTTCNHQIPNQHSKILTASFSNLECSLNGRTSNHSRRWCSLLLSPFLLSQAWNDLEMNTNTVVGSHNRLACWYHGDCLKLPLGSDGAFVIKHFFDLSFTVTSVAGCEVEGSWRATVRLGSTRRRKLCPFTH